MSDTAEKRIRTTIMVQPELWGRVQAIAIEEGASARWVVEKALKEYLERRHAPQKDLGHATDAK